MCGKIIDIARDDKLSPVHGASKKNVKIRDGLITRTDEPARSEAVADLLARNSVSLPLETKGDAKPGLAARRYSMHAFGASFAEVGVDEDTGVVRLRRMLGVFACGRILNAKTARSQLLGGMIMATGMALMEESFVDARSGHFVNHNLADYHVPIALDIPPLFDAYTIPERDDKVNPIGIKGLGEIGIVGGPDTAAHRRQQGRARARPAQRRAGQPEPRPAHTAGDRSRNGSQHAPHGGWSARDALAPELGRCSMSPGSRTFHWTSGWH